MWSEVLTIQVALWVAVALWVFLDAQSRYMRNPYLWAIGTSFLMIFVVPFFLAIRPLMDGEVREGGTAWNVIKYFVIFWTVMFVAGVSAGLVAGYDVVNKASSSAGQAGAAIGTAIGMGMIIGLWFVVTFGALVIGLFIKKSSIVEKGPTGALALERPTIAVASTRRQGGLTKFEWFIVALIILIGGGVAVSMYREGLPKLRPMQTSYVDHASPVSPSSTDARPAARPGINKREGERINIEGHDSQVAVTSDAVFSLLPNALQRNKAKFAERLSVVIPVELVDTFWFGSGCAAHACDTDKAAWAIDKNSAKGYAVILTDSVDGPTFQIYGGEIDDLPGPIHLWALNLGMNRSNLRVVP